MRLISTLLLLITCQFIIQGQVKNERLSVYLDCQTNCFEDYLKQNITFIDYHRVRQGADIYILVTTQSASAGAREIQMIFQYDGVPELTQDTIIYIKEANISDMQEMELFEQQFKKGILPALVLSGLTEGITYQIKESESQLSGQTLVHDPWNYWSFNIGFNLNVNGESSFSEQQYFGRMNASRVTKKEKIILSSWYDFNKSSFTLSDGEKVESENEGYRTFIQYVKSIGDHWSVGGRSLFGSSSFGNTDFEGTIKPAVEFNVYPYSQSSTKRFSILYSAGIVYNNYTELTVFDKLEESLWRHGIDIEYEQTQRWGDISFDINFDQYFKDASLYSISFNPNVELNLVRGLRLQFGGRISFVGDRINISKKEVSAQDIILQNRQLNTDYSYFSYIGFNYQFGSKNNNIVNPRF